MKHGSRKGISKPNENTAAWIGGGQLFPVVGEGICMDSCMVHWFGLGTRSEPLEQAI